jgi:hypothetical protein
MEVHTEQIIDIALNAAGYLLAGGLWLLVYTAWQNRKAERTARALIAKPTTAAPVATTVAASVPTEGRRSLEFVAFRGEHRATGDTPAVEPTVLSGMDRRRNRAEVFALARRMLESGASAEAVKLELPVSDGELALLHGKH